MMNLTDAQKTELKSFGFEELFMYQWGIGEVISTDKLEGRPLISTETFIMVEENMKTSFQIEEYLPTLKANFKPDMYRLYFRTNDMNLYTPPIIASYEELIEYLKSESWKTVLGRTRNSISRGISKNLNDKSL